MTPTSVRPTPMYDLSDVFSTPVSCCYYDGRIFDADDADDVGEDGYDPYNPMFPAKVTHLTCIRTTRCFFNYMNQTIARMG